MPRRSFWFEGGSPSLDFVGTEGLRRGELLSAPGDLRAWLLESGSVDERVEVSDDDLLQARALRQAMGALLEASMAGVRPPAGALEAVNAAAREPGRVPQLRWVDVGASVEVHSISVAVTLADLARDLVELLGGPSAARVRACDAEDCSGIFLDISRGGRRRWCSSESCGNRARVAAHRGRAS